MNLAARNKSFALSYDNAECLKWLALASMLIDHASKVLGPWDFAVPLGRIAFPVFAFVIGRHLLSDRLLTRLLVVGLIATVPHMLTLTHGEVFPLNILFTFAFAAGAVHLLRDGRPWIALGLLVLGTVVCDYSAPGLLLVLSSWMWWEYRGALGAAALAIGLFVLCWFNGNAWALLAVPLVVLTVSCDWRVPRIRHFFWIAYPVHLVALALIALAVRV